MKKNYVVDTNVLLHDPRSLYSFEDNHLIIPIYCLEELDKFKHERTERGSNAREVSRLIDDLRSLGSLCQGVPTPAGGTIRIEIPDRKETLEVVLDMDAMDHAILRTALRVQETAKAEDPNSHTIFVTMDTNLRIRADALSIPVQTYETSRKLKSPTSSTYVEIPVLGEQVDNFYHDGILPLSLDIPTNQPVMLVSTDRQGHTALGVFKVRPTGSFVRKLLAPKDLTSWGIKPRSSEQSFALDALLDPTVQVVSLIGKAGTGKTLLALAAGLRQVIEDKTYSRLVVARPVVSMGKELGFLPGSIEEKMNPWMQPIFDNLEYLTTPDAKKEKPKTSVTYAQLLEQGLLQVEPLSFIRGRSLPGLFFIAEESQNLSVHELKTVITRLGEGSKIVLTGDPSQIDDPYLDASSCGLTVAADRFVGQPLASRIFLRKGERSPLADLAADLL